MNTKPLAELLSRYTPHDGLFDLPIPGVHVFRASKIDELAVRGDSDPGICIIAQGAKRAIVGSDVYEYDGSRMVVYSTDVPVSAKIIQASEAEPYLCLIIDMDQQKLAETALKVFPNGLPKTTQTKPIFIGPANPHIIDAATRLIGLSAQGKESELLVPLVMEEIYIRLLQSNIGKFVVQIATTDSHLQKVSAAISWLQENFTEPMKVDQLAERVNMSISSFHHHFKAITSMSPLQFQKELRLYEAKHLMLSKMMDVSTACMHVGYSSVSQFSREYSRFFGQPPSKDVRLQTMSV